MNIFKFFKGIRKSLNPHYFEFDISKHPSHSWVEGLSRYPSFLYRCTKCNIHITYSFDDDFGTGILRISTMPDVEIFENKDKHCDNLLSCEEYIIKNIIE